MSTKKPRARPAKKTKQEVVKRPEVKKPAGKVPVASVLSRHLRGMIQRQGRGFSLSELRESGLAPSLAREWGVAVDDFRRSRLEGNVNSLKVWNVIPQPARVGKSDPSTEKPVRKRPAKKKT